jgi:cytochrome P450
MQRQEISLLNQAFVQCPYDDYQYLREQAPVYYAEDSRVFIVTSYRLIMEVLRNPGLFSSMPQPGSTPPFLISQAAEQIIIEQGFGRYMPTIVTNDPPSHTAYRKLVNNAFRAGRIRQMEAYIAAIVTETLDAMARETTCDAMAALAVPLPMFVIADQLGVPREDFPRFKEWSDAWVIGLGLPVPEDQLIAAAHLVVEMQHYIMARIHERRARPANDIMSDLVQADFDGVRKLTDLEILSIVEQILVAGNETTTSGIGNGLLALAKDQALQARLRAAPADVDAFVEEILRLESPVQGLFRYVAAATELGGVALPAGAVVMVRYAAGNRDEARFAAPAVCDLGRKDGGAHIAFGAGAHHCVGSELARAEMRAAFAGMLARFTNFSLIPGTEITYRPSLALRGPMSLPLILQ